MTKKEKILKDLAKLPATFTSIKDGAEHIAKERIKADRKRK